jgi:hypothetical protein
MRTKGWWFGSFLFFALVLFGSALAGAEEKAAGAKPETVGSDELQEGSEAVKDDGMAKSRFGEDEDDTYTDDSEHLDDLSRSKFTDEKKDDDQEADTRDQDEERR